MDSALVSVVETDPYLTEAKHFLSEEERAMVADMVAADPLCGSLIPEGGGIRKVRIPLAGRGKRGGARVIYYFHSRRIPIFLLTLFAKNERADLTKRETHALAKAVKLIAKQFGA